MAEMGHNGGPALSRLTPKAKVEIAVATLNRGDLTTLQKLVAVTVILRADGDWQSAIRTHEVQAMASISRRETVFAAMRTLDEKRVLAKVAGRGQAGVYRVLPPTVVEAIVEAFNEQKAGTVEPYQLDASAEVVRSNRTSTVEPYQLEDSGTVEPYQLAVPVSRTSTVEPHQFSEVVRLNRTSSRVGARAHFELPSEVPLTKKIDSLPLPPHPADGVCVKEGEELVGHGVIVNCETIRHVSGAFTISLPGIHLGIAGRMSREEVKQRCLAHALQWGAELEAGKSKREVVPSKVANFLSASLMGEINRSETQSVRVERAKIGGASGPKKEGYLDRLERHVASAEARLEENERRRIR